ncbi:MAG: intradiol ring-cleavage dioxygenase [Planctomyces sp.]|nr:intradiol ring-cleavage dioxygenase [Planctomyces sp.]
MLQGGLALGAAFFTTPGLFAEELMATPSTTEGPFYPDHLPLDQDNDMIIVGDSTTPAVGEISHLSGKIMLPSGEPAKNVTIEIWQCDANAVYLHSADSGRKQDQQDKNFQGYGKFETNSKGEYRFRTIKPVPYPGRPAPHIHYIVKKGDQELLTSQIFIADFDGNQKDGVYRRVRNAEERKLVQTEFKPIPDSKLKELSAKFDIVLGRTPTEASLERNRF